MAAAIYYLCPVTDQPVSTGYIGGLRYMLGLVSRAAPFRCDECGGKHLLNYGDTWLSLTEPSPPRTGSRVNGAPDIGTAEPLATVKTPFCWRFHKD